MKLYVGNLPFTTSSEDLSRLFATHGAVESAEVVMDRDSGRSRGFGFVEMGDDDGRRAIEELDGTDIGGRRLTVNEARPRQPRGGGGDRGNDRGGDRGNDHGPRRDGGYRR